MNERSAPGDGRDDDVEADDTPPGRRPDAEDIKQRRLEHEKTVPTPRDPETLADHTPGTPRP